MRVFLLLIISISINAHEFYFVRHGATDHNLGLIHNSLGHVPINALGQRSIQALCPSLRTLGVELICFSPLRRTVMSKDIIQDCLHIPTMEMVDFAEGPSGCFYELQNVKNRKNVQLSADLTAFLQRLNGALQIVFQQKSLCLIVAHGGVYSALCRLLNISTDIWKIKNAALMHFYQTKDQRWHVACVEC